MLKSAKHIYLTKYMAPQTHTQKKKGGVLEFERISFSKKKKKKCLIREQKVEKILEKKSSSTDKSQRISWHEILPNTTQ